MRLGPYEITAPLGVGGMGEVYRATDTNLKRQVAMKVLPASVAGDPERLARFQREAEILAALNHPNIAHIHGLEKSAGNIALVMELVEGPTLADRIAKGPIPLDDALPIARQIAEALEAAHEQGIIHRDLKPANVKVREDGTIKVLDFGLAKLTDPAVTGFEPGPSMTQSPTITTPAMTMAGMILGTAAYMAPEQAKGRAIDRRVDVWAFGCVLFEMLTGKRVFDGEDVSETLASVLRAEPDWSMLPAATPTNVRVLLRRCLTRDSQKRLGHLSAARLELSETTLSPSVVAQPVKRFVAGSLLLTLGAVVGGALVFGFLPARQSARATRTLRFQIEPPPGQTFPGANGIPRFALSPDGTRVVYASTDPGKRDQLWIRRLDSVEAQPIRGTDTEPRAGLGIQQPFWSPDGQFIAFFDELSHQLKKVDLDAGAVQTVCEVSGNQYSGTWNAAGTILFASNETKGVRRVSASGGPPVQVTALDNSRQEQAHLWPEFLPDGRHFLFLDISRTEPSALYVGTIDSSARKRIVESDAMARFMPPNQLLSVRGETLVTQTFDVDRLVLKGDPRVVLDSIARTAQGRLGLSVSTIGTLVYVAGKALENQFEVALRDRTGNDIAAENSFPVSWVVDQSIELSHDGKALAFMQSEGSTTRDIWTLDLQRQIKLRLTTSPEDESSPVWSPDGLQIAFRGHHGEGVGADGIFEKSASGIGPSKLLFDGEPNEAVAPQSWSSDGGLLVFTRAALAQTSGIWILTMRDGKASPYLVNSFRNLDPSISPNGRWLAYSSNEPGDYEIFVQSFPDPSKERIPVSGAGGRFPRWRQDGRELFFLNAQNRITAVAVTTEPRFETGKSTPLWETAFVPQGRLFSKPYDVTPDGQRFVAAVPRSNTNPIPLTVLVNWSVAPKE
jgi:Tol biopolymer transport system component